MSAYLSDVLCTVDFLARNALGVLRREEGLADRQILALLQAPIRAVPVSHYP